MEFLSDTVLPWFCGLLAWTGSQLGTQTAAAWAQAIFSVAAICAAIHIAGRQADHAERLSERQHHENTEMLKKQHEERRLMDNQRAEGRRISALVSLCEVSNSIASTMRVVIDVMEKGGSRAIEELLRNGIFFQTELDFLQRIDVSSLPETIIIRRYFVVLRSTRTFIWELNRFIEESGERGSDREAKEFVDSVKHYLESVNSAYEESFEDAGSPRHGLSIAVMRPGEMSASEQ